MFRIPAFIFLLCIGATSCAHYNYTPALLNTPYLTGKNESTISGYMGEVGFSGIFDFQAAYNPVKDVTVFANFMRLKGRYQNGALSDDPAAELAFHRYLDAGAGYKLHLEDQRFMIGLYAGAGKGVVKNDYGSKHVSNLDFNKLYIQPSFLFKGEVLRAAIGCRASQLAFGRGSIDIAVPYKDYVSLKLLEQNSPLLMFETGINIGLYFEPITWSLNVVRITGSDIDEYQDYRFDTDNVSIGINLDLHYFYKKKSKKN
ncbi:MAG: hypothetical protein JNJ57_11550 [Saprospiraceae bacterium]|nr:hypothetical protein [Saprospiraceae bacterium]